MTKQRWLLCVILAYVSACLYGRYDFWSGAFAALSVAIANRMRAPWEQWSQP